MRLRRARRARAAGRSSTSRSPSLFAAPGSRVVLATAGGSPGLAARALARRSGWSGADGDAAGPLFYPGCGWRCSPTSACARRRARIGPRLAVGDDRAACTLLFLLAPPLLSQDVFSYISYARLDVLHRPQPVHAQPGRRAGRRRLRVRRLKGRDERLRAALHARHAAAREAAASATAFWILKAVRRAREPRRRRAHLGMRRAARPRSGDAARLPSA